MYVRRKEANEPEVSINVVNVPWTLVQPSRDGCRETSVSSNDGISGWKRKIIKKKQAAKVPWYKRRRLLPIEALPADDQRTLGMFGFIKSDVRGTISESI